MITSLPIKNVEQTLRSKTNVDIFFDINGFKYRLFVKKFDEKVYVPVYVAHVKQNGLCSFCGKMFGEYTSCEKLSAYEKELFAHLKTFNSIRLDWLFLA